MMKTAKGMFKKLWYIVEEQNDYIKVEKIFKRGRKTIVFNKITKEYEMSCHLTKTKKVLPFRVEIGEQEAIDQMIEELGWNEEERPKKEYKAIDKFKLYKYLSNLGLITVWPNGEWYFESLNISADAWHPYITNYGGEKEDQLINELLEKGLIKEVVYVNGVESE